MRRGNSAEHFKREERQPLHTRFCQKGSPKNQDNKKRMNRIESSLITHVLPSGVSISDRLTAQASLDPI